MTRGDLFSKKGQKYPVIALNRMLSPVKGHKNPLSTHQNMRSRKYDRNEPILNHHKRSLTNANLSPPFYLNCLYYHPVKLRCQLRFQTLCFSLRDTNPPSRMTDSVDTKRNGAVISVVSPIRSSRLLKSNRKLLHFCGQINPVEFTIVEFEIYDISFVIITHFSIRQIYRLFIIGDIFTVRFAVYRFDFLDC